MKIHEKNVLSNEKVRNVYNEYKKGKLTKTDAENEAKNIIDQNNYANNIIYNKFNNIFDRYNTCTIDQKEYIKLMNIDEFDINEENVLM